jgi:hypothetical protein
MASAVWDDHDLVLCTQTGRPLSQRNAHRSWTRILARAGVEHRGIHHMRHAYITMLAEEGVHERVAQQLAGHADSLYRRAPAMGPAMGPEAADGYSAQDPERKEKMLDQRFRVVGDRGFEPLTSSVSRKRSPPELIARGGGVVVRVAGGAGGCQAWWGGDQRVCLGAWVIHA